MSYKDTLETAVKASNFSLDSCLKIENSIDFDITDAFTNLKNKLSSPMYKLFKSAVIRSSFFIELTNPTAETDSTKYQVHWADILRVQNDIRYASYEQCVEICKKIIKTITALDPDKLSLLIDYCNNSVFKYDLLIDYIERTANLFNIASNIDIFLTPESERCTKVRKLITDPDTNPHANTFKKIISKKIKVKAYLTDRAQTGTHKTNREKRWESHPNNYQFAFRRDCNDIEATLILQVCKFEGLAPKVVLMLQDNNLLEESFENYRCPITGEVFKYLDFEDAVLHPEHGKSDFQVGHLNPLKSSGSHKASNIGWISDDGNRIQGSLSMEEVDSLLRNIYHNRPELRVYDYVIQNDSTSIPMEVLNQTISDLTNSTNE